MTAEHASSLAAYVAKLERRMMMPPDDRAAFQALPMSIIKVNTHEIVVDENAETDRSYFVASGFLSRQKRVGEQKKIMAIAIPGDAVDLQSLWFRRQDHSLVAHKETVLIAIAHADLKGLCERSPHIAKALWHDTLVDAAIFREWTLNIAHRRARQRIAHFLLETATRMYVHGLIAGDVFELPLNQTELAGALGLSLVHLNKSLASLRQQGLIATDHRIVALKDRSALERTTGFDATYLHISTEPSF